MNDAKYTEAEVCTLMRRAWMAGAQTMSGELVQVDDHVPEGRSVYEARNADVERLYREGREEFDVK